MTVFSRPLNKCPLLLCGPILRRVTSSSVAVFVATKKACTVRLLIRDPQSPSSGWTKTSEPQATRQIGENLHVLVVELNGYALSPGYNYTYDVQMTPQGSSAAEGLANQKLDDIGLLESPNPLGYIAGAYPSFSLAPDLASSRILHGSCRKPHGGGPDGLVIADELIKTAHDGPVGLSSSFAKDRPHLLLLTGDQIYADDVSVALLISLRSAAADLMGSFEELFPPGNLASDAPEVRPGKHRMWWLGKNAKPELSSEHYNNHLMYLGEFYAMYLFCWSEVLWPTFLLGRTVYLDEASLYGEEITRDDLGVRVEAAKKAERAALSAVVSFAVDVRRVRRALANVPTMMAFDDHEITDDWNIDAAWNASARSHPIVNRIVRNGLAAFAVFQCWGNKPDHFASETGMKVLTEISNIASDGLGMPKVLFDPHSMDALLDVGASAVQYPKRMLWDWTLDGPGYRVIALDSRTHRDFSGSDHTGLLTSEEITRQLAAHCPSTPSSRLCFVIAPAPVIGHPLVEEIAQPVMATTLTNPADGRRAADSEAWTGNRECFENLLRTLAGFQSVVLLSGDVHYAFTNHTAYHGRSTGTSSGIVRARIVQLCASALKNAAVDTKVIQKAAYAGFESMGRGWFGTTTVLPPVQADLLSMLGPSYSQRHPWDEKQIVDIIDAFGETVELGPLPLWASRTPARSAKRLLVEHGVSTMVADEFLVGTYWTMTMTRAKEHPLVLPDGPWFTQRALDQVAAIFAADPAAWKYRTTYVLDNRPLSTRSQVRWNGTPVPASFANKLIIGQAHSVVGFPCLGEIKVFQDSGSGFPRLIHRLHWWLPDRELAMTEHEAPLNVPETGTGIPVADQIPVAYL